MNKLHNSVRWSANNVRIWGESGENGSMYIEDCFKQFFPTLVIWLLRKLKFLMPMVGFALPPPRAMNHLRLSAI
jgi:hypothetical protein